MDQNLTFSQRMGITSAKQIQLESIDDDLRNSLWNVFYEYIQRIFPRDYYKISPLSKNIWIYYFKLPINNIPDFPLEYIQKHFYNCTWSQVYGFLEFIASTSIEGFQLQCNFIFERECGGYRFVNGIIAPVINKLEIQEIEKGIEQTAHYTALNGANIHLRAALSKLSDRENPDYRNSIKESISAVESVSKLISKGDKDTLGEALNKIKKKHSNLIPEALVNGFKSIYGYASNTDGIRHSIADGNPNCDVEDATYMLITCSAFVNYLIVKANKVGIELK